MQGLRFKCCGCRYFLLCNRCKIVCCKTRSQLLLLILRTEFLKFSAINVISCWIFLLQVNETVYDSKLVLADTVVDACNQGAEEVPLKIML